MRVLEIRVHPYTWNKANYLIHGLKLWGGIPSVALRDFLEGIKR